MKTGWQRLDNGSCVVYFDTARPAFVSGVLLQARNTEFRLKEFFGKAAGGLWQDGNKVSIYLYNTREQYLTATGQPAWSDGVSIQRLRVIYSFASAKRLNDSVIAHEMAHIMFKEIVGFDNTAMPVWFEEGVASLAESQSGARIKTRLRRLAFAGKLIPVSQLNAMQIRSRHDRGSVDLFYLQAYGLADYLRNGLGLEHFSVFLDLLGAGVDFEQALQRSYGLAGTAGLEKSWLDYLRKP